MNVCVHVSVYAVKELGRRVRSCTVLGDYAPSLSAVRYLTSIEPLAVALVTLKEFIPNLKDITGRGIEVRLVIHTGTHTRTHTQTHTPTRVRQYFVRVTEPHAAWQAPFLRDNSGLD